MGESIDYKIIAAFERIAQAFRVMLWEKSKELALSPIQIQIIKYINYHSDETITVSKLANIFDLSKATVSDTIKLLQSKNIIQKINDDKDNRIQKIILTPYGEKITSHAQSFHNELMQILENILIEEKSNLYISLLKIIYYLNRKDIITIQRMCFSCDFYNFKSEINTHYCELLKTYLKVDELRIDCPDYKRKFVAE